MQHSLLDRIYLSFLAILIVSFGVIVVYTSITTKRALAEERVSTLSNEAQLIAGQLIASYENDMLDDNDLKTALNYYSSVLQADIWYVDDSGIVIAISDNDAYLKSIKNLYLLDLDYPLHDNFYVEDTFYDVYPDKVISINVPISINLEDENGNYYQARHGALILHATSLQLKELMSSIYGIIYIPCLAIIIIAFALLGIISRKIITPVKQLTSVAKEYSNGNFEIKTGISSNDEIGSLAESLEYMASEVSKLEEYRREFISNISHDFRSPLTSIKGYIEAILDGTIPVEKQERYLQIVLTETKRLTKLTSGLLDMNKLEFYGTYLTLSSFDILDVIRSTINTFEMKCIDKNVAIYLNNHTTTSVVTADKVKIQQVIYNLIDNAIKFTPSGKKITVSLIEQNDKIVISVQDEGIGMDEETQKKIWIRFYKGDSSRGKDKQGTGLGLAITKDIMKAHHENITVKSAPGEGAEFVFTLAKTQEK